MDSNGINIFSSEMFTPLMGGLQRFFTELQSSLSQHYTTTVLTLAGDFEVEMGVVFNALGGHLICSRGSGMSDRIGIATDGRLFLAGTLIGTFSNLSFMSDGRYHTLEFIRVGTSVSAYLDGVFQFSGTFSATLELNIIGGRIDDNLTTSIPYFNGIIANPKITNAGTLTHDLPLNENFAATITAVNYGSLGASGNATAVNITESDFFTLHTETDPDEWRNFDDSVIIPIAPQA